MDNSEVYLLLNILKEALGHPNYPNIRNEATKRLQEINDSLGTPTDLRQQASQAAFVEGPKSIPSKPEESAPIEPVEESDDGMRRV
jgi:hypothetical protein